MAFLTILFLFFLLRIFPAATAQPNKSNWIGLGASVSPSIQHTAWYSPSKLFAFGFFAEGSGYKVGIWIIGVSINVTVWTANRDQAAVESDATLEFLRGKILLKPKNGAVQTIAAPSDAALFAAMLGSGNFQLYSEDQSVVWESFGFPTDTVLGGLELSSGGSLLLISVSDTSVTWEIHRSKISHGGKDVVYRATLYYDENIRLYTHRFSVDGSFKTFVEWDAIPDTCDVKGFCGSSSYCIPNLDDGKPPCNCLPGFELRDTNQPFGGCERNFTAGGGERCINGKEDPTTTYSITVQLCQRRLQRPCAEECDCDATVYNGYSCFKYNLPLKYLKQSGYSKDCFLKLRNIIVIPRNTSDDRKKPAKSSGSTGNSGEPSWLTTLALSLSFVTYSCILVAIFSIFILKLRIIKCRKQLLGTRTTGLVKEFTLQTYTYKELKKGTNNFTQELGKGSFGAVYKGSFDRDRSFVAVKELQKMVQEGEREFRAEMRAIGRSRHRNLVRLLGYRIEGPKRLLVYEYMGNGSLAELLYRTRPRPDWQERFRRNFEVNLCKPEETLLSSWAYKCFAAKEIYKLMGDEEVDQRTFERIVTVALWCIQEEPALRFPVKTVMLMLVGIIDVPIPPCPSSESQT
ncbi:hypothetical protein ACH5RR_012650 [Cinchona calisaya]|uniref:non-specific serine/threonine protein kinase n=1 Tax=Cinchona calisaya TaxID=153742 RepID=A0ABD3A8E9_9GENT